MMMTTRVHLYVLDDDDLQDDVDVFDMYLRMTKATKPDVVYREAHETEEHHVDNDVFKNNRVLLLLLGHAHCVHFSTMTLQICVECVKPLVYLYRLNVKR